MIILIFNFMEALQTDYRRALMVESLAFATVTWSMPTTRNLCVSIASKMPGHSHRT